jgi:hypothetical protein
MRGHLLTGCFALALLGNTAMSVGLAVAQQPPPAAATTSSSRLPTRSSCSRTTGTAKAPLTNTERGGRSSKRLLPAAQSPVPFL